MSIKSSNVSIKSSNVSNKSSNVSIKSSNVSIKSTYRFEIGFPIERVQTQVLHEREVVSQYRRWFQKP